jgi:hypothetical protein
MSPTSNQVAIKTSTMGLPSGTGTVGVFVSPTQLCTKLQSFAQIFERYAFREVDFCFVTNSNTSRNGQLSAAYINDLDQFTSVIGPATGPMTVYQTMDYNPSCMAPVWSNMCVKMKFDGTRTWSTNLAGIYQPANLLPDCSEADYQGVILVAGNVTVDATQSNIATLMVRGTIDFYGSRTFNSTPSSITFHEESKHDSFSDVEEKEVLDEHEKGKPYHPAYWANRKQNARNVTSVSLFRSRTQ